jgi:sarcosine oxidase subunit alpha
VPPGPTQERIDALLAAVRARESVTLLERAAVVGIYEGPLVPVNGEDFLHLVLPRRVVIATGVVEHHGVFPGSDLPGVWLGRGAARLAGVHGLSPGHRVVFAGEVGETLDALRAAGVEPVCVDEVRAARGRKRLRSVVAGGRRIRCDVLVLSLGLVPRDGLVRQAAGLPVAGAGEVVAPGCSLAEAEESGRAAALADTSRGLTPGRVPAARGGFVCLCEDVEARDLAIAWEEGFRSTELLKRYTTATMGPCQGALCEAHLRAFVAERDGDSWASGPTTARPPARPIRLEDAAAGIHFAVEQRTALHERHLQLGARMEWTGAWKRPETYGDVLAEYWAVRRDVSVMDVSTLGKLLVAGRDATAFLDRLYPCRVADLEEGRIRYSLLLNEAGYVIDDGVVCPLGPGRYYVTFTTGGAEQAEAWLRDWAETWGHDVHVVNQTHALGAINVAGPKARELLALLSDDHLTNEAFPYLRHRRVTVVGVPCHALRLGFTGELGYELHHPRSESRRLWEALLEAGADLGLVPHGLEALRLLRLEKGHLLVGQDTDFDSTPAKLGMPWAARMDKPDFVGKGALERIAALPLELRLAGIRFEGEEAPPEGTPLFAEGRHVGHLTSSRLSPALGFGVALGWLRRIDGAFPERVTAGGVAGQVVPTPFYDPVGAKLRA